MKVRDRFDKNRIGELVCDGAFKYVQNFAVEIDGKRVAEYDSLGGVVENWEDYTQAEPLIEDEKIRKAVRAWAEANGVKKANPRGVGDTLLYFIGEDKGNELIEIEFYANVDDYTHLASKDTYTIAELCGEEEE